MMKYGHSALKDKEITGLDVEELIFSFIPDFDQINCSMHDFDSMDAEDMLFTVLPWSTVNSIEVSNDFECICINLVFAEEYMQIYMSKEKTYASGMFLYEQLLNIAMLRKYKVENGIWDGYVFEKLEELEFATTDNDG